jgi:hypothetical protein
VNREVRRFLWYGVASVSFAVLGHLSMDFFSGHRGDDLSVSIQPITHLMWWQRTFFDSIAIWIGFESWHLYTLAIKELARNGNNGNT